LLVGDEFGADETAPKLGTQVRSIQAAEDSVPVSIVALRAKEKVASFLQLFAGFRNATPAPGEVSIRRATCSIFFVQQIGFGIFAEKASPRAAAKESQHFIARAKFLDDLVVTLTNARGQRPFHHLRIGGCWQIGSASRSVRGEVFAGCRSVQPGRVFFQGCEKLLKPGIVVAMLECAGPNPKFLHVVAHGGHVVRMSGGGFLEIGDDLFDGAKRNQVAKNLLAGDKANRLTLILGDVIRKKFIGLETGGEEVDVVKDRVLNIGFREDGSELRLPDTLREPRTGGTLAEMVLDIVSQTN